MCKNYIDCWPGRNGNNLISILLALNKGKYVEIIQHFLFYLKLNILEGCSCDNIKRGHFFSPLEEINISLDRMRYLAEKHICLNFNPKCKSYDCLIHIRSGDIMFSNNTWPSYIQPPLSWYVDIIENGNFDNIGIVTEDLMNPVTNVLCDMYDITVTLNDVKTDLAKLMNCRTLVTGHGTFCLIPIVFSGTIKTVIHPHTQKYPPSSEIKLISKPYRKYTHNWKYDDEHIQKMLSN